MRCPTRATPYDDNPTEYMRGCGSANLDGPDDEGLVDCFDCGIWFNPSEEFGTDWQSKFYVEVCS